MNKILIIILLFILSSCSYNDGFRVEGDKVVYEIPWNTSFGTHIVNVNADAETFEVLGGNNMKWAKDKDHVYVRSHKLDFLDRDTFELLNENYGKDTKTVVCGVEPIEEADVESFKIKKFWVGFEGMKVLGIDKNAAYLPSCGIRRPSDSIEELIPLGNNFYKDITTVSWGSRILPHVNVKTFKVLKNKYATDGTNVYYTYNVVEGADAKTFKVTGLVSGKDKDHRYKMTSRVD